MLLEVALFLEVALLVEPSLLMLMIRPNHQMLRALEEALLPEVALLLEGRILPVAMPMLVLLLEVPD